MLKKSIPFILMLLISFCGFSQNRKVDSLLNILKTATSTKDKVKAYSNLSFTLIDVDLKKAITYNDSAFSFAKKENYIDGITQAYYNYSILNRALGNYDKALQFLGEYEKFIVGDTFKIARAAFQKGILNSIKGNYEEGLKQYQKALKNYESLGDEKGMGATYNTIGITYSNIGRHDESIKNHQKAKEKLEAVNDFEGLASNYANLANVYDYINEDDKALEYFNKSIVLSQKTSNIRRIARNKQNISSVYKKQKAYAKAIPFAQEAYKTLKENNYQGEATDAAANLGDIYRLMGNYKKSEQILTQQLDNLKASATGKLSLYSNLFKLYESSNNDRKALEFHKKYKRVSDSLINEKGLRNLDELQIKFDTEKKDKEIVQQKLKLEKSQTKTRLMTILIAFLLLASILLWFLFQQRQKRIQQQLVTIQKEQEVLTLESLIAGEEKERLRIAQELHDGVNGDLAAIKFKLTSLLKMNNKVINDAVTMIDSSCQQVRAISHNLVPPSLKDFNLIEAIHSYCENMNTTHKPDISFQSIGDAIDLNKKIEVNIFRIIQELVTNAVKHANASTIGVQTSNRDSTLLITVEDNGEGYENQSAKNKGIGLQNIKSRVEYLNATLEVVSNIDGTYNTIEVDLSNLEK